MTQSGVDWLILLRFDFNYMCIICFMFVWDFSQGFDSMHYTQQTKPHDYHEPVKGCFLCTIVS